MQSIPSLRRLQVLWALVLPIVCAAHADTMVNMRKVTHQTISEQLSNAVLLPCLFTLRSAAAGPGGREPPRIKWTKVWGQRGSDGLQKEQPVLVAKDNVVKVKKAFQGRVTLPGYHDNRYNASLALRGLRSSDSGLYRCEVVVGINDEQDTVPLEVTGTHGERAKTVAVCSRRRRDASPVRWRGQSVRAAMAFYSRHIGVYKQFGQTNA
ncbi:hypothetical protein NHX12_033192 [Muraenolepis orangiensis]|uniref:Ig-like domain-containing protein n=1 Tax=Muraenolepis orangiensis TaxID=630683 RepID=A0A9Q0IHR4_9TELE|nr:hypothetical protein NHX12_033192 [Muraenolepis orangiensis]